MTNDESLIGIGLYTTAEASALVGVTAGRISRWLRGYESKGRHYERLWAPQVDLGDGSIHLGFRDLMEVRVAHAFIRSGMSPQKVRRAISLGRELIGEERPLSTARFRTDGRTIFLQVMVEGEDDRLIDLFRRQYGFREIIEPSLKNVEFDDTGLPARWWPRGRAAHVVVDPTRCFGRPIEAESGVPPELLAGAVHAEGSVDAVARSWSVSAASVRRALAFVEGPPRLRAA